MSVIQLNLYLLFFFLQSIVRVFLSETMYLFPQVVVLKHEKIDFCKKAQDRIGGNLDHLRQPFRVILLFVLKILLSQDLQSTELHHPIKYYLHIVLPV